MSGTSLDLFNSFMEATGPLIITRPDAVINDAQIHRTYSFGALMGGDHGKKEMVSGGSEIRFETFFQTGSVTKFHQPGATQEWKQLQKLTHGSARWRFLITHMAWTRQAVMLNERMRYGGEEMMFHQYANYKRQLEQMMWTDKWDFLESHIWSEPDFTEEETASAEEGKWYPIPAFINEYTNGLYNNTGTAGTAWTTIHGINPASTVRGQDRYKQNTVVYSNEIDVANDLFAANTILGAFEKAWKKSHWEKPPTVQEYFSNPAYNKQQIFTSEEGQTAYSIALRASQDLFVIGGRQDPAYPDVQWNFIPVKYVSALSTATLYPAGTAGSITNNVAESSTATLFGSGPRYYWLNSEYLYPVFHEDMFFERGKIREHYNDPDSFVQPVFTWGNVICPSRIRQTLVRPGGSGDLYTNLYD